MPSANVIELADLHNRTCVFTDRKHAGSVLAGLLAERLEADSLILAIPAGGVPVAVAVAARLHLTLGLTVVSKITLPWNTEAGYGAVAFDGSVRLNEALVARAGLGAQEVEDGIARTRSKVAQRVERLGRLLPPAQSAGRDVVLVDDGLASGFTMRVAVEALKKGHARSVRVAVPTGHLAAVEALAPAVRELYCANIRSGYRFAVADAYTHWYDVGEQELSDILRQAAAAG